MLEIIETKALTSSTVKSDSSGRKRSSSSSEGDNNSDTSPLPTGFSTPPAHTVYAATPGGTPNTAQTELTASDTTSLLPPPGSSVLTESSTSSTTASYNGDNSTILPPILGNTSYPSIVSMSQQPHPDDFPVTRPSRESVLQRLSEALLRRSLQKIDLSQRGLQPFDAKLVKMALLQNENLTELKLGYNNLGDAGVVTLAAGIATHHSLKILDLGFNNIGDDGVKALAEGMRKTQQQQQKSENTGNGGCTLQTLYLAGNLIGEDGAVAIADSIRNGNSQLKKLYLTGNRIGGGGVKAITEAILEDETRRRDNVEYQEENSRSFAGNNHNNSHFDDSVTESALQSIKTLAVSSDPIPAIRLSSFLGMQELFLGGTGMGSSGCLAVARLLAQSRSLRVLSLPNCEIGDEELATLAGSIKANRDSLPVESIQLSFNRISHKGLEMLTNALWGSSTMKELELDNNEIGDRGAHHIAAIIPGMKALAKLDVGFNSIKVAGLNVLMKTVAEAQHLQSLSVSGNSIDVSAAKAVAFALAYNCSLKSMHLVHCSVGHDGQRHIAAGIVSNSRTSLRKLTGFEIGPIIVTLGFPDALKYWTNEQILNFIHMMWNKEVEDEDNADESSPAVDMERDLDPLSFLPGQDDQAGELQRHNGPLEATVVVEVAKRAFETLISNGVDVFSKHPSNGSDPTFGSPLASGAIMVESSTSSNGGNAALYLNGQARSNSNGELGGMNEQPKSFVAPPETQNPKNQEMPDPVRKKRIVEWLCTNIKHLNELAQVPFDSRELWKLHQHYFTPVVNESGGTGWQGMEDHPVISSVPNVNNGHQTESAVTPSTVSTEDQMLVPMSDPVFPGQAPASIPMLKRKVSYRCLGDATLTSMRPPESSLQKNINGAASVARIIERGHTGHSLPPKTKRARRNRTRISFLPRTKAKLDSYLDVCHEKALITMRQLFFVEKALLSGRVNPIVPTTGPRTHLSGILASEAEMIIVDMM